MLWLSRFTRMAPHTTQQMRERMVVWRLEFHKSIAEIAELVECSERTVSQVLRLHRDFGQVRNPYARDRGRPRTLDTADMNYVSSILAANPTLYLDEIQRQLSATRGIDVAISTISRTVRRIALSNKKVSTKALEQNEELRATWQAAWGHYPMDYFLWLDEASVDDRTNQRTEGWSGTWV